MSTTEQKPGPLSDPEKRYRTLLFVLEKRVVVGRKRTRVEPEAPKGVDRFVSAELRTKTRYPHGPRTYLALEELTGDGLLEHRQRRVIGDSETIVDEYLLTPGSIEGLR
jgi:hypothetical protein